MNKDATPQTTVPLEELRRIVRLMKDNDLSYFQFEKDGFKVKLRRGAEQVFAAPAAYAPQPVAAAAAAPAASTAPAAAPAKPEGTEITSPMVGTFYSAPSPGADSFVKVGDTISVGQTICIIEAMKVMNEIKAEKSGILTAIVAEDGTPVQFGATLFLLK
ncbi:MAG: acetyl-CoA carboxylase biotin carboxyl carrier protein [Verrucomicrobiales bacterium]